jgi:glycine/D-amino acid oxidase-like deaminating enzyme
MKARVLRASMLPGDLAGSGWYEILADRPRFRQLDTDIRCDWLIVGAGFAGLAAARRLSHHRPGERIVVIDAQKIAWGAAGRNTGFMIDLPHELNSHNYAGGHEADRRQIDQNRAAIAFAREVSEEYGLDEHTAAIGKLHGAADSSGERALSQFTAHLDALGEEWQGLDAEDMHRITGSTYYRRGIFTPGAFLIQPAAYTLGLAFGLTRDGVSIYEESPLLRLEIGPDHVAHTRRGSVTSPRVILATNGHVGSLGLFRRRLIHLFTYASMTRVLTSAEQKSLNGEREWGLVPSHPMGSTLRRLPGGRIVVRNVFSWNPDCRTSETQVRAIGATHDRAFSARFPSLADVEMEYRWGGQLCLSRNSVPAFGEVEKQLYVAACQNGLGTTKGTLSGMLIADLACGVDSQSLKEWRSQPPPAKLLPEPLLSVGARTYLKWMHRRAGLDL